MSALRAFALFALSAVVTATAAAGPFDEAVKIGDSEKSARHLLGSEDRVSWIYDRPDIEFNIDFRNGRTLSGTVSQAKGASDSSPPRVPEGWSYDEAEKYLGPPSRKCEWYDRIHATTVLVEWMQVCFASDKVVTMDKGIASPPPMPHAPWHR